MTYGVGCALLIAVVGFGALFAYRTRPARLRAGIAELFTTVANADVRIDSVTFSPWFGLQVTDLDVGLGADAPLHRQVDEPAQLPILRINDLRVRCKLWPLLWGRFEPTSVHAGSVTLSLIRSSTGDGNITFTGLSKPRPYSTGQHLPLFNLDRVQIQLWSVEERRLRLREQWRVSVHGRTEKTRSIVRVDHVGGPATQPLAQAELAAASGALQISVGWLSLDSLRQAARHANVPAAVSDLLGRFNVQGKLRLDRMVLNDWHLTGAQVTLSELRGSVPVEDDESYSRDGAPADRYLVFDGGAGQLSLTDHALTGELHARLHDAAATVTLRATAPAGPLRLNAESLDRWLVNLEFTAREITLPTLASHPAFVRSPRLPDPVRAFFKDYQPDGQLNVVVRAERAPGLSWDVSGSIEGLGATCRYYRFPYTMTDARGMVRFKNNHVWLDGLRARHGSGTIHGDGRLDEPRHWTGFALRFRATNVPLDGELYAALPAEYRRLWDQTHPIGLADIDVSLTRPSSTRAAGAKPTSTDVSARLMLGSVALDERRIGPAEGLVTIKEGVIDVRDLRGMYSGATAQLDGRLHASTAGDGEAWQFSLGNLTVSQTTSLGAAGDTATDEPIGLRFDGAVDVWGQAWSSASPDGLENHVAARVLDGRLDSFAQDESWHVTDGWLNTQAGRSQIVGVSCTSDAGSLTASGEIGPDTGDRDLRLRLNARANSMGQLLRQLVPPRWARVTDRLGLAGAGEMTVSIGRDSAADPNQLASIDITADKMRPQPFPLDFRNVRGRVVLDADGFQLEETHAAFGGDAHVVMGGEGRWGVPGAESRLTINARHVPINDELIAAMPEGLRDLLRRLSPTGTLSAALDEFAISMTGDRRWEVHGTLSFEAAELDLGLELTDFSGQLRAARPRGVVVTGNQVNLDSDFQLDAAMLAGRPLRDCEGRLYVVPGDPRVHIEDVSGLLCGGELRGFGAINTRTGEHEISVRLRNIVLEQFLLRDGDDALSAAAPGPSGVDARLDGHVFVRGTGRNAGSRRGGGALTIRHAATARTPILASLAEAGRRTQRGLGSRAERIELRFDWEGSIFFIKWVGIEMGGTRLEGQGRWHTRTGAIDLTLVAAPPDLPDTPILDLINIAREDLVQYRVTGTVDEPRVTLQPLHNVTDALREALSAGGRRSPR